MFGPRDGIGFDAGEDQDRRHQALDFITDDFGIDRPIQIGRFHGAQHVNADADRGPRCVDLELGVVAQPGNPFWRDAVRCQFFFSLRGLLGGQLGDGLAFALRLGRVHPGFEVLWGAVGEIEHDVAHVALGIEDQRGNFAQRRLFQDVDTQTGFARTGHAEDNPVSGQ